MNKFCIAIVALFIASSAFAQQKITVCGYISDSSSGEGLISAAIVCGQSVVISDTDGHYSISLPAGNNSIKVYYEGYSSRTIDLTLQRDTLVNIALEASERLDASVITAPVETSIRSTQIDALDVPLEAARKMPVVFGEADILKTLQLLPGIQGGLDGFSGIYVRGGGPDENLFLLDGVALYNVSHMLGLFSAFTPEAIKKATAYKGAFPARYGGRVSGILDLYTLDGDLYNTHGSVNVGLLTSKIHINGPIFKGKTSYALSGRITHTALLAPIVKMGSIPFDYFFYDLNGKIVHRFSDNDRLFLSIYNGQDVFGFQDTNEEANGHSSSDVENLDWGNTVAALRWHHIFSGPWSANTILAYNRYGMNTDFNQTIRWEEYKDYRLQEFEEKYNSVFRSGINDMSLACDVSYLPSNAHSIKLGLSAIHHNYSPSTRFVRTDTISGEVLTDNSHQKEYNGWELAAYSQDEIKLSSHLSANIGLRFVLMTSADVTYPSLQPRASLCFSPLEGLAIKTGYARMAQYVHQLSSTKITLPSDLWVPVTDKIRPVVSDLVSSGVFYDGIQGWEMSLEGYYKFSDGVIDYRDGASMFGSSEGWENLVEMGYARSYGLETIIKRTKGNVKGWLSYTLSKTERRYPSAYINNGKWYPYQFDRRHVVDLYVEYSVNRKISLNATWSLASGGWTTVPERTVILPNLEEHKEYSVIGKDPVFSTDFISSRNNYQLPPSHTLNISANFNRQFAHGERTISISVYNVYNHMNPNFVYAKARQTGQKIVLEKLTFLPILPAFNYTYKF